MIDVPRPKVAIIGAGIAGLLLAICFERAGIPYCIYERDKEIAPLGSAIYLSANVAPLLIQLGLYDELMATSKHSGHAKGRREDMTVVWETNYAEISRRFGYPGMILPRHDLYHVLLSKVPADKVAMGKQLLSIHQTDEDGATLSFADGTKTMCDLVVGSDGGNSTVRKTIYKDLKAHSALPDSDSQPLVATSCCLVGTTRSLDPSLYPPLADPQGKMDTIMSESRPYFWVLFTMPENRISFMVLKSVKDKASADETSKQVSEWSCETTLSFANDVRDFKIPYGDKLNTLGDIFDRTDSAAMSKVMLEQKLFKTWYHGRVVLIGDAVHKMSPHAGLGAISAMFDAASLSNHLNDLESNSVHAYVRAFEAYKSDRYETAKEAINTSRTSERLSSGKGWTTKLAQNMVFNWLPKSMNIRLQNATFGPKLQITFLPFVEQRGEVKNLLNQKQSKRMAPESKWAVRVETV